MGRLWPALGGCGQSRAGLSLWLRSGYGNSHSGLQKIWQQDVNEPDENAEDASMRVGTRVGYGLPSLSGQGCSRPTVR